jgi:hypothetical protein
MEETETKFDPHHLNAIGLYLLDHIRPRKYFVAFHEEKMNEYKAFNKL